MNPHVLRFYRKFADEQAPLRLYQEVIGLNEALHLSWEDLSKKAASLPKGWYELARCFFALWSPFPQARKVYSSPMERSDVQGRRNWQDNSALPPYLDWLVFFLERIGW